MKNKKKESENLKKQEKLTLIQVSSYIKIQKFTSI